MKKPLALLGVSALVGLGALLFTSPAQAEVAGDENPCNVQGWYVNPDETADAPTRTPDGFVFDNKDLIHHATSPMDLSDIKPHTGSFEATVVGKVVFKMETEKPYSTIVQNADGKFWSSAMLATQDGGQNNPVENVSDLIGKDVKPGKAKYTSDTHVVSFGVGYWDIPGSTTVKSITFHGTKYRLTCNLVTPVAATLDPKATCTNVAVVKLPTTEGVKYTKSDAVEGKVTVTATAESGFYFKKDTKTSWEFDVSKLTGAQCATHSPSTSPSPTKSSTSTALPTKVSTSPVAGLPVTGDKGPGKFVVIGAVALVLGAAGIVIARKRRDTNFVAE